MKRREFLKSSAAAGTLIMAGRSFLSEKSDNGQQKDGGSIENCLE